MLRAATVYRSPQAAQQGVCTDDREGAGKAFNCPARAAGEPMWQLGGLYAKR